MTRITTQALGVAGSGCRRAAVIGAGSMGAGIAAQFANAGVPVDLLDIPSAEGGRNARAEAGIANQAKAGGFMGEGPVILVTPGNVEDDLGRLADADWIIEAVIEDLAIKRDLFARIDAVRKPGSVVSSNTSTIPRAQLIEGRSPDFASHFVIAHFFNPPRHMELLELVGEDGSEAMAFAARAGRDALGKTTIVCRDTPGFVANRIGCAWISIAMVEAIRMGLTVEEADAVHTVFGVPRTGVFGLMDLVGIDLIPHIWGSLMRALPEDDAINRFDLPAEPLIRTLIETGRHGRKSGAGFYRTGPDKQREAADLASGDYRPARPVSAADLPGGGDLPTLLRDASHLGAYARKVLSEVLTYSALCAPEIAAASSDLDTGMELGYAWRRGPLALLDTLRPLAGAVDGLDLPPAPPSAPAVAASGAGLDRLARAKAAGARIADGEAATLWDLGEGVACLEIHTKMNALNAGVFDVLDATLGTLGGRARALVIGNQNERAFSAGADLASVLAMIEAEDWAGLERFSARGQSLFGAMRAAPAPVVAAVKGVALGGGCELQLHCDATVAHAESGLGLPEATLGLLPAWGGCTRMLERAEARDGSEAAALSAFAALSAPRPSGSAREAAVACLLRESDGIAMHRSGVLDAAAALAGRLTEGYAPSGAAVFRCSGRAAVEQVLAGPRARNAAGALSDADLAVFERIACVTTGGPSADPSRETTEADLLRLERAAFIALAREPLTKDRIRHVLKTGRPMKT